MSLQDLLLTLYDELDDLKGFIKKTPALKPGVLHHVNWNRPMAIVAGDVAARCGAMGLKEALFHALREEYPGREEIIGETARSEGVWGLVPYSTLSSLQFWAKTGDFFLNNYSARRELADAAGLPHDPPTPPDPVDVLLQKANARRSTDESRAQMRRLIERILQSDPQAKEHLADPKHPASRAFLELGAGTFAPADAEHTTREVHEAAAVQEEGFLPLAFFDDGALAARSVARVVVSRRENGKEVSGGDRGTGFLIAPGLLLTNHHVINSRGNNEPDALEQDLRLQAGGAVIEFDYDDVNGDRTKVQGAVELLAWNARNVGSRTDGLDFAILRLTPPPLPGGGARPLRPIRPANSRVKPTDAINCIQHPGGHQKQLALRSNQLKDTDPTELRYYTNTLGGSSGSPLYDDRWQVIGLHRGHVPATTEYLGKKRGTLNVGTPIHAIIASLSDGRAKGTAADLAALVQIFKQLLSSQ